MADYRLPPGFSRDHHAGPTQDQHGAHNGRNLLIVVGLDAHRHGAQLDAFSLVAGNGNKERSNPQNQHYHAGPKQDFQAIFLASPLRHAAAAAHEVDYKDHQRHNQQ